MRLNDKGAALELTAANSFVPRGEIFVERDTGKAKRGPGFWTDLAYWDPEDNDGILTSDAIDTAVDDSAATLVARVTATTAELEDIADAINTTNKYVGKMVWNTTSTAPAWAEGAAAADVWNAATGLTAHTPA